MKLPKINIPDGKNLALIAIAILLVLYAIKLILNYFSKIKAQKQLNDLPINPTNLSYQGEQYKIWADQMETILQQWPRLDEDQIIAIIKRLKTTDDYYEIQRKFGVRKISRFVLGTFEGNLNEWLIRRLSSKELKKVASELEKIGIFM